MCCLLHHGFRVSLKRWRILGTFLHTVRSSIPSDVTSHHITAQYITSQHITSQHITSHHITAQYITSQHSTVHHSTTSHHSTVHHITHITSHHITAHHIISHPSTPESWMTTPLRRHKNWCNFDLFSGHSFGSAVAYVYSALFPDDVEAYVSIDCVRALIMLRKEDLLERTRYCLDRALAIEKRLAFDPPSYTYEQLREMVHIGSKKSLSPESCDILFERGVKKLPADDR